MNNLNDDIRVLLVTINTRMLLRRCHGLLLGCLGVLFACCVRHHLVGRQLRCGHLLWLYLLCLLLFLALNSPLEFSLDLLNKRTLWSWCRQCRWLAECSQGLRLWLTLEHWRGVRCLVIVRDLHWSCAWLRGQTREWSWLFH